MIVYRTFHTLLCFLLIVVSSCTKDVGRIPVPVSAHRYPPVIADIVLNKCATSGCHNASSYIAAGGIDLTTWEKMFEGSRSGAVTIPYRTDYSTLMYYINSYDEYGTIQLFPKMPLNNPSLSRQEVEVFFDWINDGAKNAQGQMRFPDNDNRKKFYVSNQGCDVVTVFDARTMLAERYIDVGESRSLEAPHMLKVAPDNRHWYACFVGGGYFQELSTADNSITGRVNLGFGSWNTFDISSDSKTAYVIDWSLPGKIAVVDLTTMSHTVYPGFSSPHGSSLSGDGAFLYVTAQSGNYVYKFDVTDFGNYKKIVLEENGSPADFADLRPHEIVFSPDGSKYFVSCEGTDEVRVMNALNDSLIAIIATGEFPQEMSVSHVMPYLFVTCMQDPGKSPQEYSSVSVINYETNTLVKKVYAGFQSHGLAVDDVNKRVYIANRNISTDGPPPHHQSLCSGRNGYVTAIDLNTLELVPGFKTEVSIDPYSVTIMH